MSTPGPRLTVLTLVDLEHWVDRGLSLLRPTPGSGPAVGIRTVSLVSPTEDRDDRRVTERDTFPQFGTRFTYKGIPFCEIVVGPPFFVVSVSSARSKRVGSMLTCVLRVRVCGFVGAEV